MSVKKHSFYVSLGHAAQQQKLQSSPRFGASNADFPTGLPIPRSVFLSTGAGLSEEDQDALLTQRALGISVLSKLNCRSWHEPARARSLALRAANFRCQDLDTGSISLLMCVHLYIYIYIYIFTYNT